MDVRLRRLAFAAGLAAVASTSCQSAGIGPPRVPLETVTTTSRARASSAAPPLVVCGTVVSTSAAGPVVYDIVERRYPTVTELTVGGFVYVQVSDSCAEGADVNIAPSSAFTVVRVVKASDGRDELVVLAPGSHPSAVLTASQAGHVVGTLKLDIAKCC